MLRFFTIGLLLGVIIAIALTVRLPHRALFGGAALITMSAFFLAFTWSSVERCAELARQPHGGCQMYGTEEYVAMMLVPLGLGLALVAYALGNRSVRGGA